MFGALWNMALYKNEKKYILKTKRVMNLDFFLV